MYCILEHLFSVLVVWRRYYTEDEATEETGRGQEEDEAHRQCGSSQRRLH